MSNVSRKVYTDGHNKVLAVENDDGALAVGQACYTIIMRDVADQYGLAPVQPTWCNAPVVLGFVVGCFAGGLIGALFVL